MSPLRPILLARLFVEHVGRTSVRYAFTFHKAGELIACGQITTVLCRVQDDHGLEPFEVPADLRQLLQTGPTRTA